MKKTTGVKVTTPKFRATWVFLFRPRPNVREPHKKPQYSVTMLFEKGQDLAVLKQAALEAGIQAWGPKEGWPELNSTPFKDQASALKRREDGSEYLPDGYTPLAMMIEAKTNQIPGVVDQKCQPIIDETDFYSGCYARAVVVFKAYEYLGKKGITCYLQHVQKWADGDSLAGRAKAEDSFEAITPIGGNAQETGSPDDLLGL